MGSAGKEEPPFPLTEVDKWVLSQTDEEYKYHDWEELRQIIGEAPQPCLQLPIVAKTRKLASVHRQVVSCASSPQGPSTMDIDSNQRRTTSPFSNGSRPTCVGT